MTTVNVRYMVDDVNAAVAFYTTHLGFSLLSSAAPAFADRHSRRPAIVTEWADQLSRTTDARRSSTGARRLESHSVGGG